MYTCAAEFDFMELEVKLDLNEKFLRQSELTSSLLDVSGGLKRVKKAENVPSFRILLIMKADGHIFSFFQFL